MRVFVVFLIFLFLFGDDVQCLGRLGLTQIMGGGTSCQMGGLRLDHWDRIHSHLIEYPHSISMLRLDYWDRIRSHLIEYPHSKSMLRLEHLDRIHSHLIEWGQ